MFFKISKAEKLMKEAYKAWGLRVGVTQTGWLYIAGGAWAICQSLEECPKEFKGAIIGLCGDLPEPGEAYRAKVDEIQMEKINDVYVLPAVANVDPQDEPCELAEVRRILFRSKSGKDYRLIENLKTNTAGLLDNRFVEFVDPEQCAKSENEVEGPFRQTTGAPYYVWHNGLTWFSVMPIALHKPADDEPETSDSKLYDEVVAVAAAFGLELIER